MNITVTKDDIEYGQRRDPEHCAIARALMRAGLDHLGVMGPSVMVADGWGRLTSLKLPEEVSDWIFNFDAGNTVEPLDFELDLPARPAQRNGPRHIGIATPHQESGPDIIPLVINLECLSVHPNRHRPSMQPGRIPKPPRLGSRRGRGLGLTLKVG